ncbi:MAG: hypothetical protein D6815_08565 [Candidatus Dadabacteria bacterium]|nr:MAG: hypothetical protein D6815_08565 [Candidatus Dadabacteria bacterium]
MHARKARTPPLAGSVAVATILSVVLAGTVQSAQIECLDCHGPGGDAGESGLEYQLDDRAWRASVHADLDCDGCHEGAGDYPHDEVVTTSCSDCHDDAAAGYAKSVHARARTNGTSDAPTCAACHGSAHVTLPPGDPESPVNPRNLPKTCGNCHSNPELVKKYGIPVARPVAAYRASVHSRLVQEGTDAATCTDCHGGHAIVSGGDPASPVFHRNVPKTCGRCHESIVETYLASVHGKAAARGVREAPVCTDCHGEHRILSPRERSSPVYATNIPKMTCGRCHGDLRVTEKFGIPVGRIESYEDSYHGLASRGGRSTVANCASCHGVHDILPSSDPRSHVHPDNLSNTCGACHPGAGTTVAQGPVHVLPGRLAHPAVTYARLIYLWVIFITIGLMVLHNGLDFVRKLRGGLQRHADAPSDAELRMTAGFRICHAMLMVSFVVLVYSGFALKYPESWWAQPILRWEQWLDVRGIAHRAAAIVLLAAVLGHAVHLISNRRARRCIRQMLPATEDAVELRERVAYLLGRRSEPPATPAVGYPEKVEYWALLWGVLVMTVTGSILWYENFFLAIAPKWVIDLATVIHFYEAVLATCAIVVWHFYFVIFDPVVYPMDMAWWSGESAPGRRWERGKGDQHV